jgi:4'-phosphopantetheinyl transferase
MSNSVAIRWDLSLPEPGVLPGEVHVWRADADHWTGSEDDLSAQEMDRADRFRRDRDRRRYVAAHILVRRVLSHYLGVPPANLTLGADEEGKPMILWPRHEASLSFSVAHSGEVALVAVARDQSVGVDVEEIRSDLDVVAVARRALGEAEAGELAGASEGVRTQRFFELWTQEEARGKCRGTGLIEPHDERRRGPIEVAELPIGDGYVAALAVTERLEDILCCVINV